MLNWDSHKLRDRKVESQRDKKVIDIETFPRGFLLWDVTLMGPGQKMSHRLSFEVWHPLQTLGTPNAVLLCLKATCGQSYTKLRLENMQPICYEELQIMNLFLNDLWIYTEQKQKLEYKLNKHTQRCAHTQEIYQCD